MNQWELVEAAQTHIQTGDWDAASTVWQALTQLNPVKGEYWQNLGIAHHQLKNYREAIAAYEKALPLRSVRPHLFAYNIACCYALLHETEAALDWLERAFELGFNRMELAKTDADLASLRENPRYRALVDLVDVSAMSHTEGLRYDLALMVKHLKRVGYAPFRFVSEADFDKAVQKVHDDIPNLTELQAIMEFRKLYQMVGDGHTSVMGSETRDDWCTNLPLKFYLFEEGLFITRADPKHEDILGMQVTAIDDNPIQEILEATYPLVSRDNDMWLKHMPPHIIRNTSILHTLGFAKKPDEITLTLCDSDGNQHQKTVVADDKVMLTHYIWRPNDWSILPDMPRTMSQQRHNFWLEYDDAAKMLYFQFNQVRDMEGETLADFSERLFKMLDEKEVDKLVIDVRYNTGGNTYLHMPIVNHLAGHPKINQKGRLFVLIGRRTFSAAMNFTTLLERHTNALFVGEPTGSSPNFVGETVILDLPYSKMILSISDLFWQSSWPTDERTWIAPDFYVPPTFADVSAGRDAALAAIRDFPAD